MESKDQPKPKAAPRVYRVEGREQSTAATTKRPPAPAEKGAGLSIGGAFLAGVAVGLAVSDQPPPGEPAHVHLTLGDDDTGDTKGQHECDQDRDFER